MTVRDLPLAGGSKLAGLFITSKAKLQNSNRWPVYLQAPESDEMSSLAELLNAEYATSAKISLLRLQVHAEAHLPSLDFCNGVEVPAEDTTGEPHTFKFRYWINNSSRMYLLEGTQKIQNKYSTKIGDVLAFARGTDSKLLVSIV